MKIDFWLIIFSFTFLQGVLLSVSFFFQKENRTSSTIFGFLLLCIALIIAESIVKHTELYLRFPHIIGISFTLNYLIGPLYFFYFISLQKKFKWQLIHLISLIPCLIVFLGRFRFYFSDGERKIKMFEMAFVEGKFGISRLGVLFEVIVNISFILLAILVINTNAEKTKSQSKSNWAKILSYCFIGFWVIYLFATIGMSYKSIYSITFGYIQDIGLATIVIIISYYLIYKSEAFSLPYINNDKYKKSRMDLKQRAAYGIKIMQYLMDEKPFLNNDFNQKKLSNNIGISSNKLSQVFSEELGISFSDLINKMRVEEMKIRMANPKYDNITIMGIAFDVGFNSKSNMIRNFKKETNLTPSEYLKSLKK
ncbi:helix-turn-helix domain-containing protein [Flavobacteriaceae bacterium R38]|nr:helix-turn-helix domain-containing protein [Flavobacteriaceae bacterium R38]